MRIAIVCPYAWDRFGGVQSHIRPLASILRSRGHEVAVLAPRAGRTATASQDGVTLIGRAVGIPANGSVAPISFGPLAAAAVRRSLTSFRPDVVHLHEPLIPSLSLLALWTTPAPKVGTFHAAAPSSAGYRIARPALEPAAGRLAVRTAVSDAARDLIARYFPGTYRLTPNGVDTKHFASASPAPGGPGKVVLFLGRIERRKGLELLIQAMARLTDVDATLTVAGSGPQENACRALAERLGVRARWLGSVPERDKPGIYRSADVYCAPGLRGESFGIVLLEAMAAGAPVVCSDLAGFRAVVSGAARLVEPGHAGYLADALRAVLTDDEEAARMSKMSARLASMYEWERLVGGVEGCYLEALECSGQ